jgi:xanthine dehydrogenase YagR molybdenum-binding subunit
MSAIGQALDRIEGPAKVRGTATYAFEHQLDNVAYLFGVQSTIARGRVVEIDTRAAEAIDGVLGVLTHTNAHRLQHVDDADLLVLQSDAVAYRGQFVAAVVAETSEAARHAASLVEVRYAAETHDVELRADRPDLYKPEILNGAFETDTFSGNVEAGLSQAAVVVEGTYTTPAYHNNPMEPHTTIAQWDSDTQLTLYDTNQGSNRISDNVAGAFGLQPEQVRVLAPYVGGGFGSKVYTHPHVILAVLAARLVRRPVNMTLTRQQMFSLVGYRTPTIQRVRLAADTEGNLTSISHDVVEQTSKVREFAEQTAVATRIMYAAPNRRTTHRLAKLDVPVPTIMRAPGECPGMFALESAMDEMAIACGLDPVEFRIRNEPGTEPETGRPFSTRGLVACLREGARRFGWRSPARTEGRWRIGSGVAASTYPARVRPSNALARVTRGGKYSVFIDASDMGTGAWTILTQIAADALDAPIEDVHLEIGDSWLPRATIAGGSSGTSSWGTAIVAAATKLRSRLDDEFDGVIPEDGLEVLAETTGNSDDSPYSMHAYGAQFVEARINLDSGEVRLPRLVGVFGIGRAINPKTTRSQLLGGMTMGVSMALHEVSVLDPRFGDYVNHDFAEYHIATNADIGMFDISWIDEDDRHVNPMGAKGIGEVGIVGTAAAVANAVYDATGVRVRDLPITLDKLL